MIDTVLILFLLVGALALKWPVLIVYDHLTNGPVRCDEREDEALFKWGLRASVIFICFYLTLALMVAFSFSRPFAMLVFWLGLAAFLFSYVVGQLRREEVSPIFFERQIARLGRAQYPIGLAINILMLAVMAYVVADEFFEVLSKSAQ